ncbi:MAG: hypothetical protein WA839_00555 [Flavobacteriaceae bacterium]|tara:strand:- start:101 stop:1186 length:1086 start_codon:yes stop_codon:yes gene_type:complete
MKSLLFSLLFTVSNYTTYNIKIPEDNLMKNTGEFLMMPEKQIATFNLNVKKKEIKIQQNQKETTISLKQIIDYENYYSAPKGRVIIGDKTKVIHISKNVFNNDNAVEVLIQAAFLGSKKEKYDPFVIDFLLNQNGEVQLLGSTYQGTGQGSNPVFAIIDGKAYYGIYDDRYLEGFLYSHQKLNEIPYITDSEFTNGAIVFKKNSWTYCNEQNIPIEEAIRDKQNFIDKLIGNKEDSLVIDHTIQYYDMDYKPTNTSKLKIKVVATYYDPYYNLNGIRNLMQDLSKSHSIKIIPVLMNYVSDDRSLDLPGDDYGNTTVSALAENELSNILIEKPEFLINYNKRYLDLNLLKKWWINNKHLYN